MIQARIRIVIGQFGKELAHEDRRVYKRLNGKNCNAEHDNHYGAIPGIGSE